MRKFVCMVFIILILVSCSANSTNSDMQQGGGDKIDMEDINLLYINFPAFTSGELYKYSDSDLYNLERRQYYEAKTINTIIREDEIQFLSLSPDGSKALFETLDFFPKYKVFDLKSKQIIYEIEDSDYDVSMGQLMHLKFLPNLTKYIKLKEDECYLCSIDDESPIKLKGLKDFNIFNCVFSPDESMVAFTEEIGDDKYICIYDMLNMKFKKRIRIGKEDIYISQWHTSGKLLYNYYLNGYIIDIETEKVQDLGKYVFYPLLSPDGRYLAYSRNITFVYMYELPDIDEAYESTCGLYILDYKTDKIMKLDTDEYWQQEAIQWIGKEIELLIK